MPKLTVKLAENIHGVGAKGDRVTLSLQPADVHDPSEMTSFLQGYRPFTFRADEASPVVLKDKDSDKYRIFNKDNTFKKVDVKGSLGGQVPEVDPASSLSTYNVQDRFVGSFLPKVITDQADYDVMQAASKRCKNAIYLDREIDVWTLLTTDASWDSSVITTLGANYQWNAGSTSDPIADLQAMARASAQAVTAYWMNKKAADALLNNSAVQSWLSTMLGSQGAQGVFDAYDGGNDFKFPTLAPCRVVESKVLDEVNGDLDYCLGDTFCIAVSQPPGEPNNEEIATSYTFRRRGESGVGFEVDEYFIAGRGPKGGTLMVVSMADEAKVCGNIVGGLLKDVIQ